MRSIWNSRFIRTCLAVIPLLVIPLVISLGVTPGLRHTSALAAPATVLHDQFGSPDGSVVSFDNGTSLSSQAADDFVVPAGKTWTLSQVDVSGFPVVGTAQPTSFNVFFYSNASTLPNSQVAGHTDLSYVVNSTTGEYTITFPPTLLGPGTYWVSVQADTTAADNRWTWNSFAAPAVNSGAAWRNPGNGFGSGCTDWARKTTCHPQTSFAPDQIFRLHGSEDTLSSVPVLHDQFGTPVGSVVSFDNGTSFSSQAADDFEVPPWKIWTLSQVAVSGFAVTGNIQPTSFNVFFYSDNSTLPGSQVVGHTNLSYLYNATTGEYTILMPPTSLDQGRYWVSVQADTSAWGNRWTWSGRSGPAVIQGAAWRNPGNGFGSGCTDWTRKTTCHPQTSFEPDQLFRLHGIEETPTSTPTATNTATAEPTNTPTVTPTPVTGLPPGFASHYACRATKDGALRDTGVLVDVGPRPTCQKGEVLVAILVNDAP
ncbi:MAG: hypothetical protein M3437_00330 [Chloroflexota bacterium]|nr:hypothetical protein [Chloroflexota bacterium]MDQ5867746.1 hypothetical protein [Chloroflexota bacterium]